MSIDDSDGACMPIGSNRSYGLTGKLLAGDITRKDEQAITPSRGKYRRVHGIIFLIAVTPSAISNFGI